MELLLGLAIATVAVIGWWYGNIFVCVFLTLGLVVSGLIGIALNTAARPEEGGLIIFGSVLLAIVVWLPRLERLRRAGLLGN